MLEDILPASYPYKIIHSSVVSAENFQCEIRAKIDCGDDFLRWIKEFESITNSSWILRNSVSSSEKSRYLFSRNYLCHHSDFRKKKETSKNKQCSASLTVRIKRNTKSIRFKDSFVKDGYMSIIKINFKHSHKINAAEAWIWLPRCEESKRIFKDLFSIGLSPAAAKTYHEAKLLSESPESLANSRINPPARWIYRLYQKWQEENFEELNSEPSFNTVMVNKTDECRENSQESLSSQNVATEFKEMADKISTLLENCNDQEVLSSAKNFVQKYKHIKSTSDLQSFFDGCLLKNFKKTNRSKQIKV